MSDADYAAFLDKANQDASGGRVSAQSTDSQRYATKAVNAKVPELLMEVQEYYVSEADEEFVPVALAFKGDGISVDDMKNLIKTNAAIEGLSEKDFDPQNQYKKVIETVKKAGDGSVTVFKLTHTETRCEYYVVSVDKEGERVVGLKAMAVES